MHTDPVTRFVARLSPPAFWILTACAFAPFVAVAYCTALAVCE